MAEPEAIRDAILDFYAGAPGNSLAGKRVIVTAGPTIEPIDPVRFLSNRSSGKQGFAIAEALARLGADVRLIAGPVGIGDPPGVAVTRIETANEMLAACRANLPADAAICVAAVADWRPASAAATKLKKGKSGPPAITLAENPDILATLSAPGPDRPRLVVGFAAETDDVDAHAQTKLARKGCDWIVANDVSGDVMGGDHNEIAIVHAGGIERWPRAAKTEVAARLARAIAEALSPSA
jgi:phosphopantothenoylcysteine decarboxylase/phosphopantothenate--cysteine ligase